MNLFFLSWNIAECAKFHCDKHVVKMILESAQMLFTAHHLLNPDDSWQQNLPIKPYRVVHRNHPMSVWARTNTANYDFMAGLGLQLCREFTERFQKIHSTEGHLTWLVHNRPPMLPESKLCTDPPLCMPDFCKVKPADPIFCYRLFYILLKHPFATYRKGVDAPEWFTKRIEWNLLTNEQQDSIHAAMDAIKKEEKAKEARRSARKRKRGSDDEYKE